MLEIYLSAQNDCHQNSIGKVVFVLGQITVPMASVKCFPVSISLQCICSIQSQTMCAQVTKTTGDLVHHLADQTMNGSRKTTSRRHRIDCDLSMRKLVSTANLAQIQKGNWLPFQLNIIIIIKCLSKDAEER